MEPRRRGQGRLARSGRRVGVTVVGGALTLAGAVMLLLPPLPGVATLIAGLALLSTEHDWARRWLDRARRRFGRRAATDDDRATAVDPT